MKKHHCAMAARRAIALVLFLVLMASFCPLPTLAQQAYPSVTFLIDDTKYELEMQAVDDVIYCRADQWATVADCKWTLNQDLGQVIFYCNDSTIILRYNAASFFEEDGSLWVPFFKTATETGVYFTGVTDDIVQGHRAKPLALFYEDMDRMFAVPNYSISSLIHALGGTWVIISLTSRCYSLLNSSFSFLNMLVETASGEFEQKYYDGVFLEMLNMDETLLEAITDLGDAVYRPGKVVHSLQTAFDEGEVLWDLFRELGFDEKEIQDFAWHWARGAYGNKNLNDLADFSQAISATNFLDALEAVNSMALAIEADAYAVLAIQEVFANSDNSHITYAVQKAIGSRMGSKALSTGMYTLEFILDTITDNAIANFEKAYEDFSGITSLEKLLAKAVIWVYDEALSLTEKADAVIYSEIHMQVQAALKKYYYAHRDDTAEDNGRMMHSVALLYLRSCLAAWQLYEFDKTIGEPINNAKDLLTAEISNLMTYTEEELLQNGTTDECIQFITELVNSFVEPPDEKNILDGNYWEMIMGQSLGFDFAVRFNGDGTFLARAVNYGAFREGTYTYSNGKLTIEFDVSGFGFFSTIEFRWDENGFISVEKYPMQVGEDHYIIYPDDKMAKYFEEELVYSESAPSPEPARREPLSSSDLPDGVYYAFGSDLESWDENSITVDLYYFDGWDDSGVVSFPIFVKVEDANTWDISQSSIWLEGWDFGDKEVASIDAALDTDTESGLVRDLNPDLTFYFENNQVKKVLVQPAAG